MRYHIKMDHLKSTKLSSINQLIVPGLHFKSSERQVKHGAEGCRHTVHYNSISAFLKVTLRKCSKLSNFSELCCTDLKDLFLSPSIGIHFSCN